MEKEINIAAILKDKPNAKLWSPMFGECELRHTNGDIDNSVSVIATYSRSSYEFTKDGRFSEKGETMLFPSKEMQDWSKFAWKKGDVLVSNGEHVIFYKWTNNSYTTFKGVFDSIDKVSLICLTSVWEKETNEVQKNKYISQIGKKGGGKLNLSTLEIEKSQFKDGDILVVNKCNQMSKGVIIFDEKSQPADFSIQISISAYAFYDVGNNMLTINDEVYVDGRKLRFATDSEKQQLFAAIAKEGKAWDAEKKQIVDLPKKCEFKTKDWCLMRDFNETWKLCQFGFMERGHVTGNALYNAVGGNTYEECIPYNDKTAHLLGTTDDWEGGEV